MVFDSLAQPGGRMTQNGSEGSNHTGSGHCAHGQTQSDFDQISWVIAITLAILAAVSNNLGVNFQKLAWTKKQNNARVTSYRVIWLLGMLGIILASVFDFVALAFGPQSVIAPLGALTMVMNGCVAPLMHGEKLRRKIIYTTVVIVTGCALAVATASHENIICDLDGIYGYFASLTFLGYALCITAISGLTVILIKRAEAVLKLHGEESDEYGRVFKYHRVSYAFMAGLFGAQSVVFARSIGQLVMSSTRGGQLFLVRYETWLLLLALIVMIVIQMIYLNKGLERFESTYNVPVFTGTFIVGTAVSGGIVYGEFSGFTELQAALFPLGVCLCVIGVFALAWGNDDDTDEVVEEDTVGDIPAAVSRPASVSLVTPRSSLRLHSGGFTPFIIGVPEDPMQVHHIRTSRRASSPGHHIHHHHGRDLLTGLREDELHPKVPATSSAFFTGSTAAELREFRKNKFNSTGMDIEMGRTVSPRTSNVGGDSQKPSHSAPSTLSVDVRTVSPRASQLSVDQELLQPLSPSSSAAAKPPNGF